MIGGNLIEEHFINQYHFYYGYASK